MTPELRLEPVPPGTAPDLSDAAARYHGPVPGKEELRQRLDSLHRRMDELQTALYAESKHALLVVLQARDGGGKDGTIRRVFSAIDPQGCTVTGFKTPTPVELSHDFLWRVHQAVPPKGKIGVFNRSHYEDVLVARVHRLVPEEVWRPRYEQINLFERILRESGVAILKFLLHISREEQRKRLRARLEDPKRYWKFDPDDLKERELWEDYTEAYREMVVRTATADAPWYVVPADEKRVRDLLVAEVVTEALERLDPRFPGPPEGLEAFRKLLT